MTNCSPASQLTYPQAPAQAKSNVGIATLAPQLFGAKRVLAGSEDPLQEVVPSDGMPLAPCTQS